MRFARNTFLFAGVYGLIVLLPQYFLEERIGLDSPPAITHPVFFYGFIGVAVAFQLVFLVIARDPVMFRPMMIPSMVEKFSFVIAAVVLTMQERLPVPMMAGAAIDLLLGILFVISFQKTRAAQSRS